MPRLIPEPVQRQLTGLTNMTAHARRLYQQGLYDRDDLYKVEAFEAEQRGHIADTETYARMRQDGTWDRLEQVLNDPRSGSAAERELLARKTAAHYIGEQALLFQPQSEAEQKAMMSQSRKQMATFVDMSGADADDQFAVYEQHAKLSLGDKVEKPKEEPSWAKPIEKIHPDSDFARDFRLRDENTQGTRRYNAATDIWGEKRDSKGRYIPKHVLREDADRIPARKNSTFDEDVKRVKETGTDRGDGMTVDSRYGVMTEAEGRALDAYEQGQRDAAEPSAPEPSPPPSDPGPTILPNPSET
jgi:hypothetical protein